MTDKPTDGADQAAEEIAAAKAAMDANPVQPPAKKAAAKKAAAKPAPAPEPEPLERPAADDRPGIVEALSRVMSDVRAVGKDSQAPNNIGGYRFRGIDAVVNAVAPALRRHGVVVMPHVLSVDRVTTQSRQGAAMMNVYVQTRFRFHGPAGDYLDAVALGEAADAGDKATAKAQSVALRVALLQALMLPTDDTDPDAEGYERSAAGAMPQYGGQERRQQASEPQAQGQAPKPLTDLQRAVSDAAAGLRGAEVEKCRNWWGEHQVPAVADLTDEQARIVLEYLEVLVGQRPPA